MKRRPGDRARIWKQSAAGNEVICAFGACFFAILVEGPAKWIFVGIFALGFILAIRDYRRGWKIRYDLPSWGAKAIARGSPVAKEAWEATQRAAKDPNRKRYAFDKEPGRAEP